MNFLDEKALERLRQRYPVGTRIELIDMMDDAPVSPGTQGTVLYVSVDGALEMAWDNGRTLSLLPDAGDRFRKVELESRA
jgi:hypothetical protein